MGKRSKMRAIEPVVEVWTVWLGEWESTLEHICSTEAGARRKAHELRERMGWNKDDPAVTVDGPTIVEP